MIGPVDLNRDLLVAEGGVRLVYRHPDDPGALIKVLRPQCLTGFAENKNTPLRQVFRPLSRQHRRFGPYREWYREYEEYLATINRLRRLPECVAEYRGFTNTNYGAGMVVERIVAPDGSVAPTLESVFATHGDGPPLKPLVDRLFEELHQGHTIIKDIRPSNLVVGITPCGKRLRLVVIDGLSDATLVRVKTWSSFAYKRWARRKREMVMDMVGKCRAPFSVL